MDIDNTLIFKLNNRYIYLSIKLNKHKIGFVEHIFVMLRVVQRVLKTSVLMSAQVQFLYI